MKFSVSFETALPEKILWERNRQKSMQKEQKLSE